MLVFGSVVRYLKLEFWPEFQIEDFVVKFPNGSDVPRVLEGICHNGEISRKVLAWMTGAEADTLIASRGKFEFY